MEIQGKYVKNMRKYKGSIIVVIVCIIFAYLYAHGEQKIDIEKMIVSFSMCLYIYVFFKCLYRLFK